MTMVVGNSETCMGGLAVDAQYLYGADDSGVIGYPLNGGPSVRVAAAASRRVAVDCEAVYFTSGANVVRVPRVNGP